MALSIVQTANETNAALESMKFKYTRQEVEKRRYHYFHLAHTELKKQPVVLNHH